MAIQVTYSLADPVTRKREMEGLLEAIDEFKLEKGLIISYEEFEAVSVNGKTIEVIPAWYWLLRENIG